MNWYFKVMKKYAVFSGRARRKEYWMFFLFNLIIGFVLGLIEVIAGSDYNVLDSIYSLVVLVPGIAVCVRRMHDTDHSGWWSIVPIVSFVFMVTDSQHGENKYGPNPKLDIS